MANMMRLVETNAAYEASWWKVVAAIFAAFVIPKLWDSEKV